MRQKIILNPLFFFLLFFVAMAIVLPNVVMAEPKAGDVINKTNIEQYKDYLPPFMAQMVKDGGAAIADPIVIHVKDYGENLEPTSFRNNTKKMQAKRHWQPTAPWMAMWRVFLSQMPRNRIKHKKLCGITPIAGGGTTFHIPVDM